MRYMLSSLRIPNDPPELDELFQEAVKIVIQYDRASAPLLQRRLSVGYARAARLIDQLEAAGIIGPAEGSKPREVLMQASEEDTEKAINEQEVRQTDEPDYPLDYKVPTVNLSSSNKIPWGKQFSEVFNSKDFKDAKSEFAFPIGYDEEGKLHTESLLNAGNFIIAGNTLSQKENFIDTVLLTYLLKYSPRDLKLILHDPSHYLDLYEGIPHLLNAVISDFSLSVSAFKWSVAEMNRRLKMFALAGVRNIDDFNRLDKSETQPHILFVSFYNLPNIETEDAIPILTGLCMRTGIHLMLVVDRTTGKSLPTSFKSTIPARIVFRLSSAGESKAVDVTGAEKLEPGEIIYKPNFGGPTKLKATYTPEENVKEIVEAVKNSTKNVQAKMRSQEEESDYSDQMAIKALKEASLHKNNEK